MSLLYEVATDPSRWPAAVDRFEGPQLATRRTWSGVPDDDVRSAAMHAIHVRPAHSTTCVDVNPLDPGTTSDAVGPQGWVDTPGGCGVVRRAGRGY